MKAYTSRILLLTQLQPSPLAMSTKFRGDNVNFREEKTENVFISNVNVTMSIIISKKRMKVVSINHYRHKISYDETEGLKFNRENAFALTVFCVSYLQ